MTRTNLLDVVVLSAALMVTGPVLAGQQPEGVSPGAPDRLPAVEGRCPAFSWVEAQDAASYELVVYELWDRPDGEEMETLDLERASEVVYTRIPGGASSWTPALEQCLAAGASYAWFVRAVLEEDAGIGSEWSEPLLFATAAAPSALEVEHALGVLERYLEHGGGDAGTRTEVLLRSAEPAAGSGQTGAGEPKRVPRSVLSGTAAIRGQQPDPTGETYGVVGTSASPAGAGIGAANTGGGPDLVLDGSADGAVDAVLWESGVDRPSPSPQTFAFDNSDGGGITLEVDGVEVVTTATDRDILAGLSCTGNEVAKWTGASWACAPDVDTDTDTMASLGPLCTSGEIAVWAGNAWVCDADGDTLAALSCGAPDRVAKWNGSQWECAEDQDTVYTPGPGLLVDGGRILLDPAAFSKRITTLDSAGNVGQYNSLAIGADGLGLISHYDVANGDLELAHCADVLCTSATLLTRDFIGDVGANTSLAIGADGLALISYFDVTDYDLKVAHCNDISCSSTSASTLDNTGDVGALGTSLAIGADGLGLISYYDTTNSHLKVAHCDNVSCTSASLTTVDTSHDVGVFSSVAIGADGLALISYYDNLNGDLKVAHCNDVLCTSATLTTLDSVGWSTAITIGSDGLGLISYTDIVNQDLKVAHCQDVLCTSAGITTLDSAGAVGFSSSITIGAHGLGLISYHDQTNGDLKVARCDNVNCSSAAVFTMDSAGDVGDFTSIAIGTPGLALISYYDNTNGNLKVVHVPYGL